MSIHVLDGPLWGQEETCTRIAIAVTYMGTLHYLGVALFQLFHFLFLFFTHLFPEFAAHVDGLYKRKILIQNFRYYLDQFNNNISYNINYNILVLLLVFSISKATE